MAREQIKEVDVWQTFTLYFEVRHLGNLTDPDTNTLFVSGAGFAVPTAIPIVDTTGTGLFSVAVTPTADGVLYWVQRASGAALNPCAAKGFVTVSPTPFEIP